MTQLRDLGPEDRDDRITRALQNAVEDACEFWPPERIIAEATYIASQYEPVADDG